MKSYSLHLDSYGNAAVLVFKHTYNPAIKDFSSVLFETIPCDSAEKAVDLMRELADKDNA